MDSEKAARRPSIYEYSDYRQYLGDLYTYLKVHYRYFSFRYFSKRAGFSSPNFLKLVIEGKRNISADSIPRFSDALKMDAGESEFFAQLVHFNQARNSSERSEYAGHMLKSRELQKTYPLKQAEYSYYACWYYIPVRELAALSSFNEDPRWIAAKIFPTITPTQAATALRDLEALGLLVRTVDGKLIQARKTVTTEDEVVNSSVAAYHREMLNKASASIDNVPRARREISAACIPVSKATATRLKTMIQEFRREVLAVAGADQNPDSIYQINLQLFPMTDWTEGEDNDV